VPILPPPSPSSFGFGSSNGRDLTATSDHVTSDHMTSDDHVTSLDDHVTATTTPTLRFRLAEDSFYEWIAEGGGAGTNCIRNVVLPCIRNTFSVSALYC